MRRLRFLAPVLGLTLLLGACGSDDSPKAEADPTPSGSSSASPSGSESPSASDVADPSSSPVPTKAPAGETAEEFIKRWFALEVQMERTGDTAAYVALTRRCEACRQTAATVEKIYTAGGYVRPEGKAVTKIVELPSVQGTKTFETTVALKPTTYVNYPGAKPGRFTGGRPTYQISLAEPSGDQGWTVVDFAKVVTE